MKNRIDQKQLEDWLLTNGYTPDDEFEEDGILLTKYSKLGIGVRIELNL